MVLEKDEFTDETLIQKLSEEFTHKKKGTGFDKNDIAQYKRKGILPKFYGGNKLVVEKKFGINIIKVQGEIGLILIKEVEGEI